MVRPGQTEIDELRHNIQKNEKAKKKRRHPNVIYWVAVCATLGGFLFGYNLGIFNGAIVSIRRDKGFGFKLTSHWIELLVASTIFSAALMAIASGILADLIGRKFTIMLSAILFIVGSFIMTIANNAVMLVAGRIFVGAGVGATSCVVPVYVAECAPKEIRGFLVTVNQLFITIGIFISAITGGILNTVPQGWRYMFGLSGIPALIQFLFFFKMPETPRYMVMIHNKAEAERTLRQIRSPDEEITPELIEITSAVDQERGTSGIQVWIKVFRTPHVRRALFVGSMLQVFQQFCGINAIVFYGATILMNAGFSSSGAVWLSVLPFFVNIIGSLHALAAVENMGRKGVLAASFFAVGLSCAILCAGFVMGSKYSPATSPENDPDGSYGNCAIFSKCEACIKRSGGSCGYCTLNKGNFREKGSCVQTTDEVSSLHGRCSVNNTDKEDYRFMDSCPNDYAFVPLLGLVLFVLSYATGAGPMPWTINAEIYPIWARSVANSIATYVNWVCTGIVSVSFLTLVNILNVEGIFIIYMTISIIGALFVLIYVPETKGRSLEEIEFLFMHEVVKQKYEEFRQSFGLPLLRPEKYNNRAAAKEGQLETKAKGIQEDTKTGGAIDGSQGRNGSEGGLSNASKSSAEVESNPGPE